MPKKRRKIKKKKNKLSAYSIIKIVLFIAIFISLGMAIKPFISSKALNEEKESDKAIEVSENMYEQFTFEIFDLIKETYWEKIENEQIMAIYSAGLKKLASDIEVKDVNSREELRNSFNKIIDLMDSEEKKKFTVELSNVVLNNLKPFGRSGLYTQKEEKELRNNVANIDNGVDLFKELDVKKDSSQEKIEDAYEAKSEELNNIIKDSSSKEEEKIKAKEKITLINRAIETLGDELKRENYKKTGVESTVEYELLSPEIFYLALKKISPTTFDEFQAAVNEVDEGDDLATLILDLRGNVGGAIDLMQWFLGPFIGLDQYAYDFYHQGEKTPYKTKVGWMSGLVRYKKVVILIDELTQSSAEIMAASLKKYNVGILVGKTTRGWGTVENTFPIKTGLEDGNKYSAFLVHSVTLRDDNQPIEGRGVDPHVDISNENWEDELEKYFSDIKLIRAVEKLISNQ